MKKTFQLVNEKIKYPRMIEAVKAEVRKYLKRSRRKDLPKGADYWDFLCKYGDVEINAEPGTERIETDEIEYICKNASEYFDKSIEISSTAEAHGELARLLKFLGEEKLADEHQEKFLQRVGAQLPNLSMPKALDKV